MIRHYYVTKLLCSRYCLASASCAKSLLSFWFSNRRRNFGLLGSEYEHCASFGFVANFVGFSASDSRACKAWWWKRQSGRGDGDGSKESHSSWSIWWFQFVVWGKTRAFEAKGSWGATWWRRGQSMTAESSGELRVQQNKRCYSIVTSLKQLWIQSVKMSKSWVHCTWQNRMSEKFSYQDVGQSLGVHSVNSQVRLWTCGLDGIWLRQLVDGSAGRRYMQNVQRWWLDRLRVEGIHPGQKMNVKRESKESNTWTFAAPSIDGKQSVEYTFSMNIHGELPRGTWTAWKLWKMWPVLVWIDGALAFEGW